ncbi:cobalamin-binding protein [Paenibacillus sp. CAA11]|uniref:cobalamin B12-binding domain-containing protein n=1 Tax=Paenibacillus sp. CAA11 TaxID=1532905 RepID=UPI000D345157|nr:cobalamin-dependent protein [Paenibacillus sp. CAA11]AWB43977.1 cobalamin-binding protein [Paenibacillus sp. CAA11]
MEMTDTSVGDKLLEQAEDLAVKISDRQYELNPELQDRFGQMGKIRTIQDSLYSLRYLAESVLMNSPALFLHYISWLKILLKGYKVSDEDLSLNLRIMHDVLKKHFYHSDKSLILHHLEIGMSQLEAVEDLPTYLLEDNPLLAEAHAYLQALLNGDRNRAWEKIEKLVKDEVPVQSIYMFIFQPTQYEIGRLWQLGTINVAQEHFCTAVTQSIVSRLYPYWIQGKAGKKYSMVAACVGNELHEIGLRMLTDFFEMEGWNTYYLGANVPSRSLVQTIGQQKAGLVAISATMTYHVHLVRDLIAEIRRDPACQNVKIIVGGLPFNIDPSLWMEVGADGYAPNAEEALETANRLVSA